LLREIGRLDINIGSNGAEAGGKASGIRNIAPFINELAEKKPQIVLKNINLVLPQLQCDAYTLRSAIVTAIGHILVCCKEDEEDIEDEEEINVESPNKQKFHSISEQKSELFDILIDHSRDVSSYTRVAVLKAWSNLIQSQAIPLNRLVPVTELAIDRLQDKTVMVRRSAMQVRIIREYY
jgi:condensin complex subunit 1